MGSVRTTGDEMCVEPAPRRTRGKRPRIMKEAVFAQGRHHGNGLKAKVSGSEPMRDRTDDRAQAAYGPRPDKGCSLAAFSTKQADTGVSSLLVPNRPAPLDPG